MIEKVSCINLSSPYDANTFGNSGTKSISVIEVIADGFIGFGETYTGVYAPSLVEQYTNLIAKDIIGIEVDDLEEFDKRTNKHCVSMSGIARSVNGAVESAIFDILAQREHMSLCKYLSVESTDRLKCYYSGGSAILDPKQIANDVKKALNKGHNAYKMRVGLRDDDVQRVKAAREILKDKLLMVDAIQSTLHSWSPFKAINKLKEMEKYNLFWAEEFVDPSIPNNVSILKKETNTDLAFGESFTTLNEFDSLMSRHAIDIAQPDVTQCGGVRAAMRICEFVNCDIAFHVWGGPIAILTNLYVAAAINKNVWFEIPSMPLELTANLLHLDVQDGFVAVPASVHGYGLGLSITDSIKEMYAFEEESIFQTT